jgi:hypothetical protein
MKLKKQKISDICSNNPTWEKTFQKILYLDGKHNLETLELIFNLLIKNKHYLKYNINNTFVSQLLTRHTVCEQFLEELYDTITLELRLHKQNNFIKSIFKTKYNFLINKCVEEEIKLMLNNNIREHDLKHFFFNKIAKFKTSEELIESLIAFRLKNVLWDKNTYLNTINEKNLNVEFIDIKEESMLIQVNNYQSCKEIGAQAWCIVESEEYFNQYVGYTNRQMIWLDFSKPISDVTSIIGFTVDMNGRIKSSYLKNDEPSESHITDSFTFNPICGEAIGDYLSSRYDDQDVFEIICRDNLIDLYDEFAYLNTVDPSLNNHRCLYLALESQNIDILKKLLNHSKVKIKEIQNILLNKSVGISNMEIFNLFFLDQRFNLAQNNNAALKWSIRSGNIHAAKALLSDDDVLSTIPDMNWIYKYLDKSSMKDFFVDEYTSFINI